MRAAIYTRTAHDQPPERTAQVMARQEQRCRELCAQRGYEVVGTYTDTGRSAFGHRAHYDRLVADATAERFDVIVAWDLARLHRSPLELQRLLDQLAGRSVTVALVVGS